MKNKIFTIYGLFDPETLELRYIGKTTVGEARYRRHINPKTLDNNSYKVNWIKSIQSKGLQPVYEVLELANDMDHMNELEEFYIDYFKSLGCKLTNAQNGGKGSPGRVNSDETKEKIRQRAIERGPTNQIPHNKRDNILIDGKEFRFCKSCVKVKEIEHFYFFVKNNNFDYICRECRKLKKREKRKIKPDKSNYVKLSPEDYKQSRIEAARKGGQAISNSPEKRAAISQKKSKPVIATSCTTSEILEFPSALKAKESGFHNKLIHDAIKLNRPYKGYYWKFKVKV